MKTVKRIGITLVVLILVAALAVGGFFLLYKPTLVFDAKNYNGTVTGGASGYLYGIAEEGVPTREMVESVGITSLATKTTLGLQHPIAEMDDVAEEAEEAGADYLCVYLQDMYATWYYEEAAINEAKNAGTYDWETFIKEDFFPRIEQTVTAIKASDYHDKIIYCLYNECDNGVWFGEWVRDPENPNGGWNDFNDVGRQNFNAAWKLTYDYVKSLDPDGLIGGPGNFEYNIEKLDNFLSFTAQNDCTPDVIIYHELQIRSIYDFRAHVRELRELEQQLGLGDLPILVSEYGIMEDNGNPSTMMKYISCIEDSKVYGDQAYWLLANNLCSTAADYNTPNSAWWAYHWYALMQGENQMQCTIRDITHSDLGKAIKEKREPRYQQFMGVGSIADDEILVAAAGADYEGNIKVKNLKGTALYGQKVLVEVSRVTYQGIQGKVTSPEIVKSYTQKLGGSITVRLGKMDKNASYFVRIIPCAEEQERFENDNLFTRCEFENGTLIGNAYTYDSAYATTGEQSGMVGGMENDGDGVEITVNAPEAADYELMFIYGKANDGERDENGRQSPEDRVDGLVTLSVDGKQQTLSLSNTVRSEMTDSLSLTMPLEAGEHKVKVEHLDGTYVLDSLLVRRAEAGALHTYYQNGALVAIAPADGWYATQGDNKIMFLMRGLNKLDIGDGYEDINIVKSNETGFSQSFAAEELALSGTAYLSDDGKYIGGITSDGGSAEITVNAPHSGAYYITFNYSNNDENGVHSYNIDLVEDFVSIETAAGTTELYCRNTCSWQTYTTATAEIYLNEGENTVLIHNDGYNLFNGTPANAPRIAGISINEK